MKTKIIIAGAGAGGLACAVTLGRKINNADITVLERRDEPGRKILAAGNGRCNLTNTAAEYYGETRDFFASMGLMLRELDNGCVYPYSLKSETALAVLLDECERLGVKIRTGEEVTAIKRRAGGFAVTANGKELLCDFAVLASGGYCLNDSGAGFGILKSLGHSINPVFPALVQLNSSSRHPRAVSGMRVRCKAQLIVNGKAAAISAGEVQFTDYGISGIAAMELSAAVSEAFMKDKNARCAAQLDLIPDISEAEVLRHIRRFGSLKGILGSRLSAIIEKQAGGSAEKEAHTAKHWRLIITGTRGYESAQLTYGGVPESELDGFESKKARGLFVCGELIDRRLPCGGFNLDFAWHSGAAAANAIAEKTKKREAL